MKKLLALLITLSMIISVFFSFFIPASAESLYIRKIVSVVYDDSGSMQGSSWAYANYAMQAFCGMLNSEDQLYITYMRPSELYSNYEPEKIDLSSSGIQQSVDSIRTHTDSGSTPYDAVKIAYKKLKSVQDPNPNTQYWLVIITDGVFNEYANDTAEDIKKTLNKNFQDYTAEVMPNGTNPQVTFLGIGGIVFPDEDHAKGIYTYSASDSKGIIGAMSNMADRISGRTRLSGSSVTKVDDKTVRVSSSIPLLNITVFSQGTNAKVNKAAYLNGTDLAVSRSVSLSYPRDDLVGGAFLIGNSLNPIEAGTYDITFSKKVDLSNVIVLFEPALEARMTVKLNGQEIKGTSELDEAMDGDKIDVSYKIFEMGTDNEIDPSLLPPGTDFSITVKENGKEVSQSSGKDMLLKDFKLKNVATEIKASVTIEGFNPITTTLKFTPKEYVPRVVYTVGAEFGNSTRNVKYDYIGANTDLTVCFSVFADGVKMTDPAEVRAQNPVITVSPAGNSGDVDYKNDGTIVFTPKTAGGVTGDDGSFDVTVTCTLENGATASETYTVLLSTYEVIPVGTSEKIVKTGFFENNVSVSFYITKDGVKLDKSAVESKINILLNEEYSHLKCNYTVSPDGTITVTPFSDEEHKLNFGTWWGNWAYYWGLPGGDLTVTLNHAFGSAGSTIDVTEESFVYILLCVIAPLVLEILIVAAIVAYVIRYFTKARFVPNGVLYVGSVERNSGQLKGTHRLDIGEEPLAKYNTFKNLWNPFKELTVTVRGVSITAGPGGYIICNEPHPWYTPRIRPANGDPKKFANAKLIADYISDTGKELIIEEVRPTAVKNDQDSTVYQNGQTFYIVKANIEMVKNGNRQMEVIEDGTIFSYGTTVG